MPLSVTGFLLCQCLPLAACFVGLETLPVTLSAAPPGYSSALLSGLILPSAAAPLAPVIHRMAGLQRRGGTQSPPHHAGRSDDQLAGASTLHIWLGRGWAGGRTQGRRPACAGNPPLPVL